MKHGDFSIERLGCRFGSYRSSAKADEDRLIDLETNKAS